MSTRALTGRLARRASLLALGALAVHQLRYALAYGGDASSALARQGHSYLGDLAPILVALAFSLVCARLMAAAIGRLGRGSALRASWRAEWIAFAAALLAIFSVQELTEGALAAGHPGGVAAVLANGGWLAFPLALAIAAIVACVDRAVSRAERSLVARALRPAHGASRPDAAPLPEAPTVLSLATRPLPFGLARRPPPALLSG